MKLKPIFSEVIEAPWEKETSWQETLALFNKAGNLVNILPLIGFVRA